MNLEKLNGLFRTPRITTLRAVLALAVAVAADGLQFLLSFLGPVEWTLVDPVIDSVTMVLISRIIGFHILLVPTFVVELVPVIEDLPTWTACAAAVIVLRRREQRNPPQPPESAGTPDKPVIDV
jgi:hypothetical protein